MANQVYDDIINLPRPVFAGRKRMNMVDRAAQFSPFAALVGYEDIIEETARLTENSIFLDDNQREILDRKQQNLLPYLDQMPEITITYFSPDHRKSGGQYVTVSGHLKSIIPHSKTLILADGTQLSMEYVIELDSPIFQAEL